MSQTLNTPFQVTPAEMRKAVFGWIGNGRTDDSVKKSFELYTAIFGLEFVAANADDTAFIVRPSNIELNDGADYKLRPIAGLLVSVASVTPAAPAKGCGGGCTCLPAMGIDWAALAEERAALPAEPTPAEAEAPSKPDRIKVLKKAIKQLSGRHMKPGASVKKPYQITEPKADLRVFVAADKKSYLAVLTSNPPKSVIGVQATTLRELQEALEECLDAVENNQEAPTVASEHMDMAQFRKQFGV